MNAQLLPLDDHFGSIGVRPDSEQQQLYSCVANVGLYSESDVRVLAVVLKGVDITEVFSPERVDRRCFKYGLIAGTRSISETAMVVKRVVHGEESTHHHQDLTDESFVMNSR